MGDGRPGTFEYIDKDGDRLAVSMVGWGNLRRLMVSLLYKISKPNRYEFPSFVPAFELAVFRGNTMRKPVVLVHFSDEAAARRGWSAMTEAMRNRGLQGATDYVCNIQLSEMKEFGKLYPEAM